MLLILVSLRRKHKSEICRGPSVMSPDYAYPCDLKWDLHLSCNVIKPPNIPYTNHSNVYNPPKCKPSFSRARRR